MFWKILVAYYYFLVESDVMMMKTPMYITLLHYSKLPRLDKGLDILSVWSSLPLTYSTDCQMLQSVHTTLTCNSHLLDDTHLHLFKMIMSACMI